MNQLIFIDKAHEKFFYEAQHIYDFAFTDLERTALFYTLGLMRETRVNIRSLYAHGGIVLNGVNEPFQTSGSRAITSLAFVLFNDFKYQIMTNPDVRTSPSLLGIFCSVEKKFIPYMFTAISIRLGMVKIDA